MLADRKKVHIVSLSILAVLLVALLVPSGSGRILAAILLLPSALLTFLAIKKRSLPSLYSRQVLLIIGTIGALYVMMYYISALHFGFTKTGYGFKADILLRLVLPIATIIVCSEVIRYVLRAQQSKLVDTVAYFICLIADVLICSNIHGIRTFSMFMDVLGITLFPGILYNLLYHYLSLRYGMLPNILYRVLTVLLFYLIPYGSAIPDSMLAFFNLLLPIVIYLFIDAMYEKKRRYALGKQTHLWRISSRIFIALAVMVMAGTIMLISNQFRYGALVIATDSMTGELNRGDAAIFEAYDGQQINVGQVIVFEKNRSMTVHRVVDIDIINGEYRYYTKGDANEDNDPGYVTNGTVIGLVHVKVPYVGFPTLWLRSLFSR